MSRDQGPFVQAELPDCFLFAQVLRLLLGHRRAQFIPLYQPFTFFSVPMQRLLKGIVGQPGALLVTTVLILVHNFPEYS